jgi:diguanylate cyclase (GGDEF)-like protein
MIDLDHFKQLNDTFGHLTGDTVLRAVATAIARTVRDHDIVGRFGGDEFLVLLADTTPSNTAMIVDRVHTTILTLHATPDRLLPTNLTASIGTAIYPHDGATLHDLLHHADMALYTAKTDSHR